MRLCGGISPQTGMDGSSGGLRIAVCVLCRETKMWYGNNMNQFFNLLTMIYYNLKKGEFLSLRNVQILDFFRAMEEKKFNKNTEKCVVLVGLL